MQRNVEYVLPHHDRDSDVAIGGGVSAASLRHDLLAELRALEYPAFARCVADLLARLGYRDIRLAERVGTAGRRTKGGGYDATMAVSARLRAVARFKQYGPEALVYRRQVNELLGAAVRVGAAEAVLVTTGGISDTVRKPRLTPGDATIRPSDGAPAAPAAPAAPLVRLIDGEELARLMVVRGLGVRRIGNGGRTEIDRAYFRSLRSRHRGSGLVGTPNGLEVERGATAAEPVAPGVEPALRGAGGSVRRGDVPVSCIGDPDGPAVAWVTLVVTLRASRSDAART